MVVIKDKADYKYKYSICVPANEEIFYTQCAFLETIPGTQKERQYTDVDGSILQFYELLGNTVVVLCDQDIDAVYIVSDEDLSQYLKVK